MFNFIYSKRLITDTSSEQIAYVRQKLDKEGISYYLSTKKSIPSFIQISHVQSYQKYNIPYSSDKESIGYVYYIYVKRKDYQRALECMD